MGTKSKRNHAPKARGSSPPSKAGGASNGRASAVAMNSNVEMRRKPAALDSKALAENLMSRESFSLDDDVPKTPVINNHGFFELPVQDQKNFGLLVLLYFLQGIPMGLAMGSVPFLLKNHMSYGEI